jgi:EAL domain-containing protein (putative c-di-GMP-specific phosphodiesterase class I)
MSMRDQLAKGILEATSKQEIQLCYQPIISFAKNTIVGAEVFARWVHPKLGVLHAADFIPLAEETGTILELDEWIISQACRDLRQFSVRSQGEFRLALNVSALQVAMSGYVDVVCNALHQSGVAPHLLELDLKPEALRQKTPQSALSLEALKAIGVSLALDDFGASYSSIQDLVEFEPNRIKINPVLIRDISSNGRLLTLVSGLISTCQAMAVSVCPEGIESESQLEILQALGCTEGQGFLFGGPVPADQFLVQLKA